ncbi:methyltransferase [Podospora australis]|uniref:Methyltransferase n=1 Tax=Podospora australis TaxID=1536484 RepID=A0AAN7AES5_9PEZI|nr:methyltransferase [Podospora australis]
MSNYTQGYSRATTRSHASRTIHSDAKFLIPHVKPADMILDVGCGPGTITVGFSEIVGPQGKVAGIDISSEILEQAKSSIPPKPNLKFRQADLLSETGLPFPDETFDVVFSSQLFPHLTPREIRLQALKEMRRVLKTGGVLATRDAAELHFYPRQYNLDEIWVERGNRARAFGNEGENDAGKFPGGEMPALYRECGFASDNIIIGGGTTVHSGKEAKGWFSEANVQKLSEGDAFRESWLRAGITDGEIEETKGKMQEWARDENGWYVALQAEIVARK